MRFREEGELFTRRQYLRVFVVLFLLEVIVEVIGYQVMGRRLIGGFWPTETRWEPLIHAGWMLIISTPIVFGWLSHQLRQQRRYLQQIHDQQQDFRSLFTHHSAAMVLLDNNGHVQDLNPAALKMLGAQDVENPPDGTSPSWERMLGLARSRPYFEKALQGETVREDNTWMTVDARPVYVEETHVPFRREGKTIGVYLLAEDVTQKREAEQRLWHLAHHDALTSLPNRAFFHQRLTEQLANAQHGGEPVAVLFVDLDRFKYVNDALGHRVGDAVLQIASERMAACLRPGDILSRFGGDEFCIGVVNAVDDALPEQVAQAIIDTMRDGITVEGSECYLTASVGIVRSVEDTDTADTLIRKADAAMYQAKRRGKNRYVVYAPSLPERFPEWLQMEHDLRSALAHDDQLFVAYQPKVAVSTGWVVGAEALVRWQHPRTGIVSPGDFIPLAEDAGLIAEVGRYVQTAVCRQLRRWMDAGLDPLPVSINASPLELDETDFVSYLRAQLDAYRIPPTLLAIEITESALLQDTEATRTTLEQLRAMGIQIEVDDFGKGYSALGYLKHYPIDVLKVDELFTREIDRNPEEATVLSAIITLAHARHIRVVAEGVERSTQLSVLQEQQCDDYQGFLFSPPVSAERFGVLFVDRQITGGSPMGRGATGVCARTDVQSATE